MADHDPFVLRDYQQQLIDQAIRVLSAGGVPCMVLPTGGGKTAVMAELARQALGRGHRVVAVAHRQEIVEQLVGSLQRHLGPQHMEVLVAGRRARYNAAITVGMVPTMARRLGHLQALRGCFLLQDECHHAGSTSWGNVTAALAPHSRAGLTATPIRPNGKGLGQEGGFTRLVLGPQPAELMAGGHLCSYRLFAAPHAVSVEGLRKRGGDFATSDLEQRVVAINGNVVPDWQRFNPTGASTIAVAVSVEHAHQLAGLYQGAGITAAAVDGTTPTAERRRIFDGFRAGTITVLCACAVIDEGLDVPSAVCLQLTRPTASVRLIRQLHGRVLRPAPGKDGAIIIDHTDNWKRLPLPCAAIPWELHTDEPAERLVAQQNQVDAETGLVVPGQLQLVDTGEQLVEITPGMLASTSPQRARRLLHQQVMAEAQAVLAGRGDAGELARWWTAAHVLEPAALELLGQATGNAELAQYHLQANAVAQELNPRAKLRATKLVQAQAALYVR